MIVESERDVLGPEDNITVATSLLQTPAFRLDSWYWFRKGERAGLSKTEIRCQERERTWKSPTMGTPVEEHVVAKLETFSMESLEGGNDGHFACVRKDNDMYEVYDYHMALCFDLPAPKLWIPEFNVVHWHAKALLRACLDLTGDDLMNGWISKRTCPAALFS